MGQRRVSRPGFFRLIHVSRSSSDFRYLIPTYDNDNLLCLLEDILELNEEDFATYVRNGNTESVADKHVHETIPEGNEDEKEDEEAPDQDKKVTAEETDKKEDEAKTIEDHHEESNTETTASTGIVVIPEDLPELEEDSPLNDPELREQLQ